MSSIRSRRPTCSALALAVILVAGPGALASPIPFSTTGFLNEFGAPDPSTRIDPIALQHLHFEGTRGTLVPGANAPVSLGRFVIDPMPSGTRSTLVHVPFDIELRAPSFNQTLPQWTFPDGRTVHLTTVIDNSIVIHGFLDGSLDGPGTGSASKLTASIDSVKLGGLRAYTADHIHVFHFPIPLQRLQIDPQTVSPSGDIALRARIAPVPEPAPLGLLATTLIGLVLRRRRSPRLES